MYQNSFFFPEALIILKEIINTVGILLYLNTLRKGSDKDIVSVPFTTRPQIRQQALRLKIRRENSPSLCRGRTGLLAFLLIRITQGVLRRDNSFSSEKK